jgi:hypothetical protein
MISAFGRGRQRDHSFLHQLAPGRRAVRKTPALRPGARASDTTKRTLVNDEARAGVVFSPAGL